MNQTLLRLSRAISIIPNNNGELVALNTNTGSAFRITTLLFSVLETFSIPSTIENAITALIASTGEPDESLRNTILKLCEQGALVATEQTEMARHDRNYFGAYQHLYHQREMLMDSPRTIAFEAAIKEIVSSEDIVIDAGSGTGILALMAARAGAKKVYAIERSRLVNIARAISERNGYAGRIEFAQCMAEEFTCSQPATVLVSELLGDFVLRELSFKSFCSVRDRCLAPGARTIPSRVRMYIAPVEDALLWMKEGPGYWHSPVYGFDYSDAFEVERARLGSARTAVAETSLLDSRALVHDIDYENTPVEDFYFDSQVEFCVTRDGTLHGLAGSFDMQLSPSVWLDTGSLSKETHWQQVFFPLPTALSVEKNDRIVLKIKIQDPENPQKRIPDTLIDIVVWRGNKQVHQFSEWYDKARQGVF